MAQMVVFFSSDSLCVKAFSLFHHSLLIDLAGVVMLLFIHCLLLLPLIVGS